MCVVRRGAVTAVVTMRQAAKQRETGFTAHLPLLVVHEAGLEVGVERRHVLGKLAPDAERDRAHRLHRLLVHARRADGGGALLARVCQHAQQRLHRAVGVLQQRRLAVVLLGQAGAEGLWGVVGWLGVGWCRLASVGVRCWFLGGEPETMESGSGKEGRACAGARAHLHDAAEQPLHLGLLLALLAGAGRHGKGLAVRWGQQEGVWCVRNEDQSGASRQAIPPADDYLDDNPPTCAMSFKNTGMRWPTVSSVSAAAARTWGASGGA
jgi:hypothetical protein